MAKTVRLPDGRVLTFPDSATPEQIQSAIANMSAPAEQAPPQAQRQIPPLPSGPGFDFPEGIEQFSFSGDDIQKRIGQAGEIINRTLGLPVDLVTQGINFAARQITGKDLIDPSQVIGGRQSIQEFGQGTGEGVKTLGRGVGLLDPQTEEERLRVEKLAESPSFVGGQIFAEVAPFLAPAAQVARIPSLLGRAGATGVLGAAEAATIASGQGRSLDETLQAAGVGGGLGVSLEIFLPVLGRVASAALRRITGKAPAGQLITPQGTPTKELTDALDASDVSFDDLNNTAISQIRTGVDPIQAERAARFAAQDIPATRGIITQDDIFLGAEETLLGRADEAARAITSPLRQRKQQISAAFERNAENLVDDLGLPDDVGASIKDALTGRRKILRTEKNRLYQAASDADPELARAPIVTDDIAAAIPERKKIKRISNIPGNQVKALDDLLVEFGINKNPDAVEAFVKGGDIIEPLSFNNFEDFRQSLNAISRADNFGQGATSVALVRPVLKALDDELNIAFSAIEKTGQQNTLDILKQARAAVVQLKTEFDPKDLANKLVSTKKGSRVPTVEASEVFKTLTLPGTTREGLTRTLAALRNAPNGKVAIGNLQSSVVFHALEDAISAVSNKSGGVQQFSPAAFNRSLNKFGDKLDIIFAGNKTALKQLRDLQRSAADVVTPASTKPKGSAPAVSAILDILGPFGRLPVVRPVIDAVGQARGVSGALKVSPQNRPAIEYIQRDFPALASVLAITLVTGEQENGS
ncbi:MAG: hypothetical protein COB09_17135 [Thalassobium sp.]|nr:MAG: hypothetical protein COB09_17135 [Thalassobium sp.]